MFMIRAGVTSCGGEVPHCVQSEDSLEAIMRHLSAAVEKADMVITTGGVSVGKKDYPSRSSEPSRSGNPLSADQHKTRFAHDFFSLIR